MTNTFFKGLMASESIDSMVGSCLYQVSGENAPVTDGAFVVLGNLAADTTYAATGDIEYNTYLASAPAAVTDEVVVIDYSGVSAGSINGNDYKFGVKQFNLTCPAGENARYRRLALHDKFWLTDGCFNAVPTVGKFANLAVGKVKLAPANTKIASGFAIKVLVANEMTTGQYGNGLKYLCEVVAL